MARLAVQDSKKIQSKIERAALRQIIHSGYNGVAMRGVAKEAKVPLGSLYNYFKDKESLFKHLVELESQYFLRPESPLVQYLLTSKFPDDLELFAKAIALSVEESASYFKLMYIDAIEFDGKNFRKVFSNLDGKFNEALKSRFVELGLMGPNKSLSPSFVFVTIYLNFYQHFVLSKLFGASDVYGQMSEQKVIKNMVHLFKYGFQGRA